MKKYYKATDENMQCRGVQFKLGEWSEPVEGELEMCKNGYHFCEHISGVWAYYPAKGTRVFECEVQEAVISKEPGTDAKSICRSIKPIKEVEIGGDRNTGDGNTGDRNTGDRNTGYWNTGDRNTGYWNTGDGNTGDGNTGDRNTGDRNTGDRNTGDRNTGDGNTGDYNIGKWNTGKWNTGDRNTGDYNIGNHHTGVFGLGDAPFLSFGEPADRETFPHYLAYDLWDAMKSDKEFDVTPFLEIPNATEEKIREFHKELIKKRGEK